MRIEQPFHEGEMEVQRRAGESREAVRNGQVIGDEILRGALDFIERQPVSVWGSLDQDGDPWASILIGRPGFLKPDGQHAVDIDLAQSLEIPDDPLYENIARRPEAGMLVIDLATRRRLRVNGQVWRDGPQSLRLDVEESYPNCPKYIQKRHLRFETSNLSSAEVRTTRGEILSDEQRALIRAADTFFVASAHPERGVDASHRGGEPGFVEWIGADTLRVPDYAGNSMFNTLGNLTAYPRAGLAFLDFERHRLLQLTGDAEVRFDLDDPAGASGGTRRFWDVRVRRWRETDLGRQLGWEFLGASPFNPKV